jgi:hypothetical protein
MLVRDAESYIFRYDDESAFRLLRLLDRYANDPEVKFSWRDNALLSLRIRRIIQSSSRRPAASRNP